MDFLDPRKRRSHRIRLIVGYVLVSIAIALGTVILVYGAYGYSIDTKTGDIVENGLLFVDSKPGGATIYLNDSTENKTTSSRLILPSGDYKLTLKKTGYRDWQRSFALPERSIARFVYPLLIPTEPASENLKSYPTPPGLVTQSPDRRWLIFYVPAANPQIAPFEEIDTDNPSEPARPINLPTTLFGPSGQIGRLSVVEWSSDNNYLLIENKVNTTSQFILLDRRDPERSLNINQLFATNPTSVALRDKKIDQVYLHDLQAQTLRRGDISKRSLEPVLLNDVLEFKPYGNNILAYVTDRNTAVAQASARIWDNGRSWPLATLPVGDKYLIDVARFDDDWYFVAGSNAGPRVNVYKNPLDNIRDPSIKRAVPIAALEITGATEVSFSTNTRFVGVQAGQNFAVFDFERKERHHYSVPAALAEPMQWMDGHRFIGSAGGLVTIFDYDSTNSHSLAPTVQPSGGYFNREYNQMFTLAPIAGSTGAILQRIDMRAGSDLPRAN